MITGWNHLWKSDAYRKTTALERRLLEIRFVVARALHRERRRQHITQANLAKMIGCTRATISRLEQASDDVSLDYFFRAMIALGANDAAIAKVFRLDKDSGVRILRRRAAERFFPKPSAEPPADKQRRWGWRTRIRHRYPIWW